MKIPSISKSLNIALPRRKSTTAVFRAHSLGSCHLRSSFEGNPALRSLKLSDFYGDLSAGTVNLPDQRKGPYAGRLLLRPREAVWGRGRGAQPISLQAPWGERLSMNPYLEYLFPMRDHAVSRAALHQFLLSPAQNSFLSTASIAEVLAQPIAAYINQTLPEVLSEVVVMFRSWSNFSSNKLLRQSDTLWCWCTMEQNARSRPMTRQGNLLWFPKFRMQAHAIPVGVRFMDVELTPQNLALSFELTGSVVGPFKKDTLGSSIAPAPAHSAPLTPAPSNSSENFLPLLKSLHSDHEDLRVWQEERSPHPYFRMLNGIASNGTGPRGIAHFPEDWKIFEDHFPKGPKLVPGILQVELALQFLGAHAVRALGQPSILFRDLHVTGLKEMAFPAPILQDRVVVVEPWSEIRAEQTSDKVRITCDKLALVLPPTPEAVYAEKAPKETIAATIEGLELEASLQ